MLFAVVPSKAIAQTLNQPKTAENEQTPSEAQVKSKADLKAIFAKEITKVKTHTLTAADYEKIEKVKQAQVAQQGSKKGWNKKDKIILVVFIAGLTALITALLIHGIDNSAPDCINDPSNLLCT